jgi:hypothetical protein
VTFLLLTTTLILAFETKTTMRQQSENLLNKTASFGLNRSISLQIPM